MEPITRKENFLARIAGEDGAELEPITREEHFLQKIIDAGGGGGGGTSSKQLNVIFEKIDDNWTCNKTFAEIVGFINANGDDAIINAYAINNPSGKVALNATIKASGSTITKINFTGMYDASFYLPALTPGTRVISIDYEATGISARLQDTGTLASNMIQSIPSPSSKPIGAALTIGSDGYVGWNDEVIKITYADLKTLRDQNKLAPGTLYRITDYNTIITGSYDLSLIGASGYLHNAVSAGHQFDVIVLATGAGELSENALATLHEGDTYFADSNLGAWELKYCLDNDSTRFAWANTNGKGVIWWMKDEWNNQAGYDFKNIQFLRYALAFTDSNKAASSIELAYGAENQPNRYGSMYHVFMALQAYMESGTYVNPFAPSPTEAIYDFAVGYNILGTIQMSSPDESYLNAFQADLYYTFDFYDATAGRHIDASLNENPRMKCTENYISLEHDAVQVMLYRVTNILGLGGSVWENNSVELAYPLETMCLCTQNELQGACYQNTFGHSCGNNKLAEECYSNIMGSFCAGNTFGRISGSNMFEYGCQDNMFGEYCRDNMFKNHDHNNKLEDHCDNNVFNENCSYNLLGYNCCHNIIRANCAYNTFGRDCSENSLGGLSRHNSIGNYNNYNIFGNEPGESIITGAYLVYCRVLDDVNNISITSNLPATVRYLLIKNGSRSNDTVQLYDSAMESRDNQAVIERDRQGVLIMSWQANKLTREGKYKASDSDVGWVNIV